MDQFFSLCAVEFWGTFECSNEVAGLGAVHQYSTSSPTNKDRDGKVGVPPALTARPHQPDREARSFEDAITRDRRVSPMSLRTARHVRVASVRTRTNEHSVRLTPSLGPRLTVCWWTSRVASMMLSHDAASPERISSRMPRSSPARWGSGEVAALQQTYRNGPNIERIETFRRPTGPTETRP